MHYFKRNIGDYHKKAGRLSMLEHGAYTLLIDACYDREVFPTKAEAVEWTWARSAEEISAVEFVLSKFFTLEDGRYIQSRIQEEIEQYRENAKTNKRIAEEREAARRERRNEPSTDRPRTVNEPPPNHKPLTNNQEPLTIEEKAAPEGAIPPGKSGKDRKGKSMLLSTYLDSCKAAGVKPFHDYPAVRQYGIDAGLPDDLVKLAWLEFKFVHTEGTQKDKKYKVWGAAFLNCLKGNWYRYWYLDGEEYKISQLGLQAQTATWAKDRSKNESQRL